MKMKRIVYADNAATTKLDKLAFEEMTPYLLNEYGNPSQPYSFSRRVRKAISDARQSIAHNINANPDEIYFTSGGTESNNWAIQSMFSTTKKSNHMITSEIEHHAVLHTCESLVNQRVNVTYLAVDRYGLVDLNALATALSNDTGLVSIMLANNEIGTINPIQELARVVHQKQGVLFHTDAVQAVGHIPINVKALDVDFLSASAHKFNGPKGVGFLYIKKGISINPYMHGGSQEFGKRAGTENVAGIVGMATALQNNVEIMLSVEKKLIDLEKKFMEELKNYGIKFMQNGASKKIAGNINLSFEGVDGELILHRLDLLGVSISTGSACNSNNTRLSHVIRAIGVPENYANGSVRISFGKDNSVEDVLYIASAIQKIISTCS